MVYARKHYDTTIDLASVFVKQCNKKNVTILQNLTNVGWIWEKI